MRKKTSQCLSVFAVSIASGMFVMTLVIGQEGIGQDQIGQNADPEIAFEAREAAFGEPFDNVLRSNIEPEELRAEVELLINEHLEGDLLKSGREHVNESVDDLLDESNDENPFAAGFSKIIHSSDDPVQIRLWMEQFFELNTAFLVDQGSEFVAEGAIVPIVEEQELFDSYQGALQELANDRTLSDRQRSEMEEALRLSEEMRVAIKSNADDPVQLRREMEAILGMTHLEALQHD